MLNTAGNPLESVMKNITERTPRLDAALAYAKVGASVVFVETRPGEDPKKPLDLRTVRERANDDKAAQKAAREAGNPFWEAMTSGSGRQTATDNPARLRKYWDKYLQDSGGLEPNVGLDLEGSGVVGIDADHAHEVRDVQERATAGTDTPPERYPLTTSSPGQTDAAGKPVHEDGGHFLYVNDVPDLPLVEEFKLPGGAVVSMAKRYIMVPPSRRPEGPYINVGPVQRLSDNPWLVELIRAQAAENELVRERRAEAAEERAERRASGEDALGETVAAWNDAHPWAELLEAHGWTLSPRKKDGECKCPVWKAPGDHGSDKSATAHEAPCGNPHVTLEGNSGPLHHWTSDVPPELAALAAQSTAQHLRVSKLQFAAAMRGQTDAEFMAAEGILGAAPEMPAASAYEFDPAEYVEAMADPDRKRTAWDPVDLDAILDGTYAPEETSIMPRADGLCLMYPGLVHSFHGESESGKSMLLQWVAAQLLEKGEDVLYVDYESDAGRVVGRLRDLGASPAVIRQHFTYVRPDVSPDTDPDVKVSWAGLLHRQFALAVVDGVTESLQTMGLGTNNNDEVTQWVKRLPRRIAHETGAAVALADHVTKAKDNRSRFAIGGQAKMAALDGAAYMVKVVTALGRGRRGELVLYIGKDRPGYVRGQLPPQAEMREDRAEAVAKVIVDSTGGGGIRVELLVPDPMSNARPAGVAVDPKRPTKIMEAIHQLVAESPGGLTKTEVYARVGGRKPNKTAALSILVDEGYLVGRRGERLKTVPGKPYREATDERSAVYQPPPHLYLLDAEDDAE